MKIKLFDKEICDNRFYLMIADTLDAFAKKDEQSARAFAEALKEDIGNIIDEATDDWIAEQEEKCGTEKAEREAHDV